MSRFVIRDKFYLDGAPFQIISGAIHYFRVHPDYWLDRLEKLKAMGCNTVETYVPWNLHEPSKGRFSFSGELDLARFLSLARTLGLYAIVRPSPYICAEWEFGGLPAWLLAGEDIPLRSSRGPFLSHVADYYRRLFQILTPLQLDQGGPIILMQVENEFGSWGQEDPDYLAALRDMMRAQGVTVPLVTADNLEPGSLDRGKVPGALPTVNFGSAAAERLPILARHVQGGPLMVMEFWNGWFDAWGDQAHHTAPPAANAADLDDILSRGSVNFYMFHGGTNPGLMNGSNYADHLTPDVTSYDYDAPLSEDGQLTPKYHAFRQVIARHAPTPPLSFSTGIRRIGCGTAHPSGGIGLFDALSALSTPQVLSTPRSMEQLGQSWGYTLYRTSLPAGLQASRLEFEHAADRAQIFLNGKPVLTLFDRELTSPAEIDWALKGETRLDILVENLGRVNFGPRVACQRKGLHGAVRLDGRPLSHWEAWPLSLEPEALARVTFRPDFTPEGPGLHRFTFQVEEPGDTFLDASGWGKGCAFLNGRNMGRFWLIGPQRRLYIPAPLLRTGENELILLETEGITGPAPSLEASPNLG